MSRRDRDADREGLGRAVVRLLLGLAVLVAAYVGVAWYASHTIPARATAGGISIGGLSPEEARRKIADRAPELERQQLTLTFGTASATLTPAAAGLHVDGNATISDATQLTLDPRDIWQRLTGEVDYPLRSTIDRPALQAALRPVAAQVDHPVREGVVTFPAGSVTVVRPQAGARLDLDRTADAVTTAWPARRSIEGVVTELRPRVDPALFDQAVTDIAKKAVDGPLSLTADGRTGTLTPAQLAPALSMVEDGGTLALAVAEKELLAAIRSAAPTLERPPVDARLRIDNDKPVVVPSAVGRVLTGPSTVAAVTRALTLGPRTATLALQDAPPQVTVDQVNGWGIVAELGRATVRVDDPTAAGPARLANLARAAALLDGAVVQPGGTFSFNATVGARSATRGFTAPTTPLPGPPGEDDAGVSLVASAVYEAAFRGGLAVGPRSSFSVYHPGTTAGLDARVSEAGPDVTFTGDPQHGVLVSARAVGGTVQVILWGRAGVTTAVAAAPPSSVVRPEPLVDASSTCVAVRTSSPGFAITVSRVVTREGVEVLRDSVQATYAPLPAVTCTS